MGEFEKQKITKKEIENFGDDRMKPSTGGKGEGFSNRKEQQGEVFEGTQTWRTEGIGLAHHEPWGSGMR